MSREENRKELQQMHFDKRSDLLMHFLRGAKKWFVMTVLFSLAVSVFDLINPKIIGFTVDSIIGEESPELTASLRALLEQVGGREYLLSHLYIIALLVVVVALLAGIFRYISGLANSIGAEKLLKNMRDDLYEKILSLPYRWHGENQTGDIIQRCTSDVETVKRFLSEQLTGLFRIILLLAVSLTFMLMIDVRLTLSTAIFYPIIVLYSFFFESRIKNAFRRCDEEEGKLSAIAQENLTGVRVVRAFGREQYERERFEKKNEYYTGMWVHLMRILAQFWMTGDFISGMQALTAVSFGAYLCAKGQITAGQYVTFISYNTLITWPIRHLGRIIAEFSKAGISVDRILYIMNAESEKDEPDAEEFPAAYDISFENVTFRYGEDRRNVLQNVSLSIKEGETVGILGGTGSGKSTAIALLDRLYEIGDNDGTIKIGGVDIRKIKRAQLRRNVGMILQEPYLFSRSIKENIRIAADEASMEAVESAAQRAALTHAIAHFEQGYETAVGERGVTLSGGQKQRTAIAQMLIRNTPIMIFDDSLSAVDAKTDAQIRKSIREMSGSATVLLVSHRITTLMECDRIYVLDRGKLAECGTHDELLSMNGIYRRIYDLQTAQM